MNEKELEEFIKAEYAFASGAKRMGAITFDEFLMWVDLTLEKYDNLPTFMFDLINSHSISEVCRIVAQCYPHSSPEDNLTLKEYQVFWGIAFKRFPDRDEDLSSISRKTALKRLEQYPHVIERFKKTFPFIKLDF